jgi:hypothetical protein
MMLPAVGAVVALRLLLLLLSSSVLSQWYNRHTHARLLAFLPLCCLEQQLATSLLAILMCCKLQAAFPVNSAERSGARKRQNAFSFLFLFFFSCCEQKKERKKKQSNHPVPFYWTTTFVPKTTRYCTAHVKPSVRPSVNRQSANQSGIQSVRHSVRQLVRLAEGSLPCLLPCFLPTQQELKAASRPDYRLQP